MENKIHIRFFIITFFVVLVIFWNYNCLQQIRNYLKSIVYNWFLNDNTWSIWA
jgi:hypothetical protein